MKAAVHRAYGPPEAVTALEHVDLPSLEPDEVLIKVEAAGVNWADWSMTMGVPYLMRLGYGLRRPRAGIRGTDVAGIVDAVGPGVRRFRVGDNVLGWCTAAFAEYVVVGESHLAAKPDRISFEQAAGVPMAGMVALQALRDIAAVKPGNHVLINGASGDIGTFAVQLAKYYGAEVTAVCSTANLEFVRSLGADHVIDYTVEDVWDAPVRYDVILDMVDTRSLADRRRRLAAAGTLIPNSGVGGPVIGSVGRILSAWALSPFIRHRLRPFLSRSKVEDLQTLTDLIESGRIVPVVGKTYALSDTGAAIADAGSGHGRGKVVVTV